MAGSSVMIILCDVLYCTVLWVSSKGIPAPITTSGTRKSVITIDAIALGFVDPEIHDAAQVASFLPNICPRVSKIAHLWRDIRLG
ncbi:hypothetical protein DAEQUDRAFT_7669 [Daedalea quercina L-15889]|uniref:Uncharacterized protein n=1 Tax=Daedalea quercina L-15889 TaxID=1314783 RepID=A0A165UEU3_9APHY|nr:hypothetical protein DAEQUDRAFT_7669 [Daedalea quercina L-15889]